MTKKEQLIKVIYDRIMKYGSISSRGNELYTQTAERIENKITSVNSPSPICIFTGRLSECSP